MTAWISHQRNIRSVGYALRQRVYWKSSFFSFTPDGVFRVYLADCALHSDAKCTAHSRESTAQVDFGVDLRVTNTNPGLDNHSLVCQNQSG